MTVQSIRRFIYTIFIVIIITACTQSSENSIDDIEQKWPKQTINVSVFSSAGGATDLANRALAEGMKPELSTDIVINNMAGALGGTAVHYVWNQAHDGYRLVGISESALAHSVLGLHTSTAKDWEYFMVGGTPGIISVNSDSPFKTFDQLYTAIKEKPETLTISTSVPGSVWNIQWLNAKKLGGFATRFIPYSGSFPSQTAALSGEVDIVWTGLGEQSEFLKSGNLRALAVFDDKPVKFNEQQIPPITDYIPNLSTVMPINQFVGFAIPSDTSVDILTALTAAFKNSMKSRSVKEFAKAKYSSLTGLTGEKSKKAALAQERIVAWTLWDAGIGSRNPADLGIDKPK